MSHPYFAYGGNMSHTTIKERATGAMFAGKALLEDHRLAFTLPSIRWTGHAADIIPAPGSVAWGVLWELANPNSLDEFEKRYDRVQLEVLQLTQGNESAVPACAFTYTVKPRHRAANEAAPARAYLERMIDGARRGGLPAAYIADLVSHADTQRLK